MVKKIFILVFSFLLVLKLYIYCYDITLFFKNAKSYEDRLIIGENKIFEYVQNIQLFNLYSFLMIFSHFILLVLNLTNLINKNKHINNWLLLLNIVIVIETIITIVIFHTI